MEVANELENLLRAWEDDKFLAATLYAAYDEEPKEPCVRHWDEFRKYLLSYRPETPFDFDRFGFGQKKFVANALDFLGNTRSWSEGVDFTKGTENTTCLTLARWVACSKRIFCLSHEMQSQFERINLGNIRLSDVVFPFASFGVKFARPVINDNNPAQQASFVVISDWFKAVVPTGPLKEKMEAFTSLVPYGTNVETYPCLTAAEKSKLQRLRSQGLHNQHRAYVMALHRRVNEWITQVRLSATCMIWNPAQDVTVEEFLQHLARAQTDNTANHTAKAVRLVINLCLYLQSLPSEYEESEGRLWQKQRVQSLEPRLKVVSDEALVCQINGAHIIKAMIRRTGDSDGAQNNQMIPHWRRAHKRRPPGKGNDPTAEKSVKVKHTLVMDHLLPEGAVVSGSYSIVQ